MLYGDTYLMSSSNDTNSSECYDVIRENRLLGYNACYTVLEDPRCAGEGFIPYLELYYCWLGDSMIPLAATLTAFWILVLFITAGLAADNFLCPSLSVIAKNLHLSENLAGVTFLAFGNGAPDIMSSVIAVHSSSGDPGLAIGELLGGGIFVTTVVGAAVAIICPFLLMRRPFIRDIFFYVGGTIWVLVILVRGKIYLAESIGFLVLYGFYVVVAVGGRIARKTCFKRFEEGWAVIPGAASIQVEDSLDSDDAGLLPSDFDQPIADSDEDVPLLAQLSSYSTTGKVTWYGDFVRGCLPREIYHFKRLTTWKKIVCIVCVPFEIILNLTVPVVLDVKDDPKRGWHKILRVVNCVTLPMLVAVLLPGDMNNKVGGVFPSLALALIIALLVAATVFFTSSVNTPPWYHVLFAYIGFFGSCVWVYLTANEIVASLQTLGIALNISTTILGLTVLAWGNSIPDFIADTSMARRGAPRVGISAVIAGPMMNLLLGVGISFTFATSTENPFPVKTTPLTLLSVGTLLLSLVFSFVFVTVSKFHVGRLYGGLLLGLYVVFLSLALPTSLNVLF
ncbi:Sodium/potassium/calcium exchanger 6, mitochondrial [Hypsibius exemplaris]|uniref:Sodium/potassium/calcium exchanger 6, mitochondrial n=1 Tax=Hypsibius exemplaris TaxID=2072580 RepID=A0A1W0X3D2_HYPEX|nr:Sodium/potassium/calcium exchanger 6, mitochondrial [Hypsibius exemplaris]